MSRSPTESDSTSPSPPRSPNPPRARSPSSVPLTSFAREVEQTEPKERVSFYVQAADEMLSAVLDREAFLLNPAELSALQRFQHLSYEARYLYMRLFLRKQNWHRINEIGYHSDLADVQGACAELCEVVQPSASLASSSRVTLSAEPACPDISHDDSGFIDLTMSDDEDEVEMDSILGPAREAAVDYSAFAVGETTFALLPAEDLLVLLSLEEMAAIGRLMRIAPNGKKTVSAQFRLMRTRSELNAWPQRADWTRALLKTTDQSTLSFFRPTVSRKGKEKAKSSFGVGYDSVGRKLSLSSVVVKHVLKLIGPTIRLTPSFISLFNRVSLIYHRTAYASSATSTTSLTASLLARFGKRRYPDYKVSRTYEIFTSRSQLCEYEAALELERKTEEQLESWGKAGLSPEEKQQERERTWKDIVSCVERIIDKWGSVCRRGDRESEAASKTEQGLLYYRKRFHPGWPLTRIVMHAAGVYARLHEHDKEVGILEALLSQHSFLRGKRGAWYDRLVLVLTRYPSAHEERASGRRQERLKRARIDRALAVCLAGIADPFTHLIYLPSLQRRVARIESSQKIEPEIRREFDLVLNKASVTVIVGERLDEPVIGKKSVWRSIVDADLEVSVEGLVLEHYVRDGWKGFHSENSIITTIFALVFWDIIFAPVDGVFETAFQPAPLDLSTDAFAIVRKDLIEKRMIQIRQGGAADLLDAVDDRERPLRTWCVGVNWDYSKKDMLEIIKCMGGSSLAMVLKMLVEEYGHRIGGLPDLCLWHPGKKKVKFSEVKGPGDQLSETQRVWIDVLIGSGVDVEVAKVTTPEAARHDKRLRCAKIQKGITMKRKAQNDDMEDSD